MLYRYGGLIFGTGLNTNKYVRMYQSPKLELVVNQSIFWDPETYFADIVLPACTAFERNDIAEWTIATDTTGSPTRAGPATVSSSTTRRRSSLSMNRGPITRSYFAALADKLGLKEAFTEGNTEEDWIEKMFHSSSLPKYMSFEEFRKRGYLVCPLPEGLQSGARHALVLRRPSLRHGRLESQDQHREGK